MNTPFFNKSKEIADAFIQSALFVDDEIYGPGEESQHALNSQALVKAFAKAKKLCALNSPKTVEDFEDVIHVALKSDITILDWQLNLEQSENVDGDDEEDVAEIDPRGTYTLQLIEKLIAEDRNELKLILIYTGETGLQGIVEKVFAKFQDTGIERISENILGTRSYRIGIAGKPSLKGTFTHTPELNNWILQYEDVPDYLLTEFTKMTSGLVSNVALKAISSIRSNVDKILKIYNKDLDPAFLAHRAMLDIPEDAGELLKDSIVDSFDSILDYSRIEENCNYKTIEKWFDSHTLEKRPIPFGNKNISIDIEERKKWHEVGFVGAMRTAWLNQHPDEEVKTPKIEEYYRKKIHRGSILEFFNPKGSDLKDVNERFSILTHHKSSYANPSYRPKLSLGAIVKEKTTNKYLLCIQQKCDSIRINNDDSRRFLFIPLEVINGNGKFNIVARDPNDNETFIKLKVIFTSHGLKTIRFKSNKNGAVYAEKKGKSKQYTFYPIYYNSKNKYRECYHWVLDLKDSHAQRIANKYAASLSRVGLDEYEWLRRWAEEVV